MVAILIDYNGYDLSLNYFSAVSGKSNLSKAFRPRVDLMICDNIILYFFVNEGPDLNIFKTQFSWLYLSINGQY